jgi:hypothetical protein
MATKRPAKIAKKGSKKPQKMCPITGKAMTPVKVFRQNGPSGMFWVVLEDFDGSPKAVERMLPTH